jgi:hypothetical protein
MIDLDMNFSDISSLRRMLEALPSAVQTAAEDAAKTLKKQASGNIPRKYSSGDLTRDWNESGIEKTASGFSFGTDIPYAVVLEEGQYRGVGPHTIANPTRGGIFSTQAPEGILWPLLNDERNLQKIGEHIARTILKEVQKYA